MGGVSRVHHEANDEMGGGLSRALEPRQRKIRLVFGYRRIQSMQLGEGGERGRWRGTGTC